MKTKILGIVAIVFAVAGYNVYISQDNVKLSDLALNNVEALANSSESGQPDVNDCISDDDHSCIALHPTDPSKDEERPRHVWP